MWGQCAPRIGERRGCKTFWVLKKASYPGASLDSVVRGACDWTRLAKERMVNNARGR
ncbi:unnamed protein product [Chondrus crispus]|uniref:Uncharacterized protein n=1 Tax=Chondrus crispus TaxID=2769 RepID=R7QGR2_CHOCR|nr:unnamed protein product [Chondrus crispus]CDF36938.1 unnamed protein product [Chondrus crispus]|eukprot:XP_005716757.1 unnamed protein product [Chondrus crispus]